MQNNFIEVFSLKNLSHYLQGLIEKKLWAKVLFAMVLGILAGIVIGPTFGFFSPENTQLIGGWLAVPGTLFLKLVQMIMIPLIFASIIGGITALDKDQLKKLGLNIILYFIFTTTIAVAVGILIVYIINPGQYFELVVPTETVQNVSDSGLDTKNIYNYILNIIPDNPLASMVSGEMLSIVVFTMIIGVALTSLSKKTSEPLLKLTNSILEVCMIVVKWSMKLVPYAVFGLIAQLISSVGIDSLFGLGMYILSVLLGLTILLAFYGLLVFFIGKRNPFQFFSQIKEVQLLAFSTTSSAAVMPLSLKVADEKLKVNSGISNFLIPIGATLNMDGTAIYQVISTVFIAQAYGVEMGLGSLILVMATIIGASIGTPSIPGGGVIVLASVLQSIGIPAEGIIIIIGVERILGMFRTSVNVTGDLTATVIFDKLLKKSKGSEQIKIDKI